MKNLKLFESWIFSEKDPDMSIDNVCKRFKIKDFKINSDRSIDVNGDVNFYNGASTFKLLYSNKIPIKFNRVNGNFNCFNIGIKTLENCPVYIVGDFDCSNNKLETLIDGPKHVDGDYRFNKNNLKDVYGFPEIYQGIDIYSKIRGLSGSTISTYDNPVSDILSIVGSRNCNFEYLIKFMQLLNEYQVIRNGDIIIGDRLVEALYDLDNKPFIVRSIYGYNDKEYEPRQEDFENYKLI